MQYHCREGRLLKIIRCKEFVAAGTYPSPLF